MRVLFDQGTPVPLRTCLGSHHIETVVARGWSTLANSDLLIVAEREGFDVVVTSDKNLRDQQKPAGRRIGIVVLSSTSWPRIQRATSAVKHAIDTALPGSIKEVAIP